VKNLKLDSFLLTAVAGLFLATGATAKEGHDVKYMASDKSPVIATLFRSTLAKTKGTIFLFHQASASGLAEFENITPKFTAQGFSTLVVDQRSGGERFGGTNRTVGFHEDKKIGYCEAYPDLQATLDFAIKINLPRPYIALGSSYSAALVLKLAAKNSELIDGVVSFSPASGGAMAACKGALFIDQLSVPARVYRPGKEMEIPSVQAQKVLFTDKNIDYVTVQSESSIPDGVHGASMLDGARAKMSVEFVWKNLTEFLNNVVNNYSSKTTILNVDGWKLATKMSMPKKQGKFPAVLLLHSAAGNKNEYLNLAKELSALGIASMRIDLRAHGESTNLGLFGKPYKEKRKYLTNTDKDIVAAIATLKMNKNIDANKIGVVGASYSGEFMAVAARNSEYQAAYVALSPGSFSDESISNLDKSGVPWLMVRAEEELQFFDPMFDSIKKNSKTAEIKIVSGKGHATNLMTKHEELSGDIANWLAEQLN